MTNLSLVPGVIAEYEVAEGRPTVILRSAAPLGYTAASYGLAAMAFVWESAGKSQVWRFYPEIPQSEPIQFEEKAGVGGSQLLSVTLDGFEPATGLLKGEMDGEFLAPAIHIETSVHHMITGHSPQDDIWLFLMRSPWFPLKLGIEKSSLSLTTDSGSATASISIAEDGSGIAATISVSGTAYKKASLSMRRTVGDAVMSIRRMVANNISDELIGEVEAGTQTFAWKPIVRNYDLLLTTFGKMDISQIEDLARGFGATVSSGPILGGRVQGDLVLCDCPRIQYSLVLTGDRGWLKHDTDEGRVVVTW
ncbi:MAG: hypothetical protein OK441_05510 [Thaumarchaeota archaeon]|nr:hypothetical protein [Nitrososphaerota archaeon]